MDGGLGGGGGDVGLGRLLVGGRHRVADAEKMDRDLDTHLQSLARKILRQSLRDLAGATGHDAKDPLDCFGIEQCRQGGWGQAFERDGRPGARPHAERV